MVLSKEIRAAKLAKLAEIEGRAVDELIASAVTDSVCPGICIREGCDYTTEVEPDQDRGFGECGHGNSVASVLILAGIV